MDPHDRRSVYELSCLGSKPIILDSFVMDLLNGYSSSDTESSDRKDREKSQSSKPTTLLRAPSTSKNQNAVEVEATPSTLKHKKGKKLVSLAAVLPQHIFDQLTRSQDNGGETDDESDDDLGTGGFDSKHSRPGETNPSASHRDPGLSTLLTELNAAPTSGFLKLRQSQAHPDPTTVKSTTQETQPLGLAFLSTTTTVERRSHKGTNESIRNIHDTQSAEEAASSAFQSTVKQQETPLVGAPDGPVFQAHPAPSQSLGSTHSQRQSKVPAAFPRVSVAPQVKALDDTMPSGKDNVPVHEYAYPIPNEQGNVEIHHIQSETKVPLEDSHCPSNPRKRGRKELERALRHGQLDAVETDLSLHADTNQYNPSIASLNAVPPSEFGIKVAPTAMYDPSVGGTVGGHLKGRGKNQINHVMAAAAHLEEQRRQQYLRDGSAASGKTHRANAKQKYGW